jgi:superfamily I DNA and RNA helicase
VALDLIENRGYTRDHIAVLTTKHRHPMQAEARHVHGEKHWDLLWEGDDIFYSTVAGFKGLERPVIVLVVDGFHNDLQPRNVMYTGMSRARDLLIVVGDHNAIKGAVGDKIMRRLQRGKKLD